MQMFTFTVNADGTITSSDMNEELVTILVKSSTEPAGFQIGNTPGAALPNTGGPGTRIFYMIGALATILAASGLIVMRKRRENIW